MFKTFATTAVLAVSFTGAADANETAKAFLGASPEGQASYITTSLAMAQTIVAPNQAACIREIKGQAAYADIIDKIRKYSDHHPTGVIAAYVEKQCGAFEVAKH